MSIKTQAPTTVLYRGDIRDTAVLVGLVQARIPIGIIAYTGPLERDKMDYLRVVNLWLESKDLGPILIHPYLSYEQLERIPSNPLQEWGWTLEECKVAIKLAGLPLANSENKSIGNTTQQSKESK